MVLSDDEDDADSGGQGSPEQCGKLHKWTNYIHGWQERWIELKDGTLAYYKSANETSFGCRGAITIHKATIRPHEFDECRFDVSVNDCVWYLRADTAEERQKWVETLETYKAESGYGSENNLRRHGSAISLTSNTLSGTSTSSFKKGRGLREKLAEMETFKDILCQQVEMLQSYYDACAESVSVMTGTDNTHHDVLEDEFDDSDERHDAAYPTNQSKRLYNAMKGTVTRDLLLQHGAHAIDFKGEAITFKATTTGILATLSHCIELMAQREETWRRRVEKEIERRKKIEDLYHHVASEAQQQHHVVVGGPDYEEGPHSALKEDEFYDAVDAGLDKLESEEQKQRSLSLSFQKKSLPIERPSRSSKLIQHPLWPEIDKVTAEQLNYARMELGEGGWFIFAEDGEMKMYKREIEEGGVVVDPLKAVHTVKGFTGHEMCHYFFDPDVRLEWETTLETMKVVETVSDDCLIFHQVHKRVWPAAQRDALFWSHIRHIPDVADEDAHDIWIVCNNSTEYVDAPIGKCVRVKLTVCLVCHTFIDPPSEDSEITRNNLTCKITYCAIVNPGGWAPASVLRAVYKREYPKFLKRFTNYVKEQTENKPIMF